MVGALQDTSLTSTSVTEWQKKLYAPWIVHDLVNQFVVENKSLLWRSIESEEEEWQMVCLPDQKIPCQAKADWNSLMVLDTEGYVHYTRSAEGLKTLMKNPKWHKGIWDFPLISKIFNDKISQNPNFSVPSEGFWSTSFLESGCYYIDHNGNHHSLGAGRDNIGPTNTAYVVDNETRRFRFYDPYVPPPPENKEAVYIPFPETSTSTFEPKGIASSRSGIFCIGYDISQNQGGGVSKDLALYFISADANLLGLNPAIRYTHNTEPKNKKKFALPASLYQKIDLPKGENVQITGIVGVERSKGEAMTDVILTIEGCTRNSENSEQTGYFHKVLGEEEWRFTSIENHQIDSNTILQPQELDPKGTFSTTVADYKGSTIQGSYPSTMENFGTNSLESKISVVVDKITYPMFFYPKQCKLNIFGSDITTHTLVVPAETRQALGWDTKEVIHAVIRTELNILMIIDIMTKKPLLQYHKEKPKEKTEDSSCSVM